MTTKRMTTWHKATALVPLALLSGAWTASLAVTSATAADSEDSAKLPDGTTVPAEAIEDPANISAPGQIAPGVTKGSAKQLIKDASVNGIPAAALTAYQRAAQVIATADPSCKVEWPLIAAIGRVESDHGRYGGNVLTAEGVSKPGIYGIALDGSNGTQKITDTDGGQYDHDKVFDRAVGAMQFIPSTWSVVGVDGNGDGKRDPQNINDSALAAAVYLCSGDEDLSTRAGQESAVFRYNHSDDYVSLVLSIAEAYASGHYSAVPTSSTGTTTFIPSYGDSVFTPGTRGYQPPKTGGASGSGTSTGHGTVQDPGTGGTTSEQPPAEQPPAEQPPADGDPTTGTNDPGKTVGDTVKGAQDTVEEVLITTSQAVTLCTNELKAQFGSAPQDAVSKCVGSLTGMTMNEAQNAVGGVVASLGDLVDSLVGGATGGATDGATDGVTGGLGG